MKSPLSYRNVCAGLLVFACGASAAHAGLIHRFSFTDGKDAMGNVTATPKGDGASFADGQLVLKNDLSIPVEKISFLEFSAPLLPKSGTSASFVVWFTAKDIGEFARVLNFGDSEGGEGKQFIYFSPRTAEGMARAAITGTEVGAKTFVDPDALDDGKPHMVAVIIDGAAKKLRVYVDGKEPKPAEDLGDNTLDKVKPVENWLGKSSFINDAGLTATIDELRVYDHALTLDEAAAAFTAGPNTLPPATSSATTPATGAQPAAPAPAAAPASRSGARAATPTSSAPATVPAAGNTTAN